MSQERWTYHNGEHGGSADGYEYVPAYREESWRQKVDRRPTRLRYAAYGEQPVQDPRTSQGTQRPPSSYEERSATNTLRHDSYGSYPPSHRLEVPRQWHEGSSSESLSSQEWSSKPWTPEDRHGIDADPETAPMYTRKNEDWRGSQAHIPLTRLDKDGFDPANDDLGNDGKPLSARQRAIRDLTERPDVKAQIMKRMAKRQRFPYLVWTLTAVMVGVFVYELVRNKQLQGSVIQTSPFNPLVGPSQYVLVSLGARFDPCMRPIASISNMTFPCLTDSANPPVTSCALADICAMGGLGANGKRQAWRFVTPIFLHGGLVHILINMLIQLTAGAQIEKEIGCVRFALVYFLAGIGGFAFGANFALVGLASTGASGALYGIIALSLVDLIVHWKMTYHAKWKLFGLLVEIAITWVCGLLPGIDNFSHLGGFIAGLLLGTGLLPMIHISKAHQRWIWIARTVAVPSFLAILVVLFVRFYTVADPSVGDSWARYIACIPIAYNNYCQGTGLTTTTTTTSGNPS